MLVHLQYKKILKNHTAAEKNILLMQVEKEPTKSNLNVYWPSIDSESSLFYGLRKSGMGMT